LKPLSNQETPVPPQEETVDELEPLPRDDDPYWED